MTIEILKSCGRELAGFPLDVREDMADALARLEEGHLLSMPLSRPMPSIEKGVHELRLRDQTGIYRVIYVIRETGIIELVHAFKKKGQRTPKQAINTAKQRL